MTEEEQHAFEQFDKPEWVACGNLRLRVLLAVCHETITRLGGKIENLQDSLAAADRRIAELEKDAARYRFKQAQEYQLDAPMLIGFGNCRQ